MTTASASVFYALHRTIATWPTLSVHRRAQQPFPTGKDLSPAVVFVHHFVGALGWLI